MQTFERYGITWLKNVDSTSSFVKSRLESLPCFSVVSSLSQSEGHGASDHIWHSSPGENLTFTILVKYTEKHCIKACDEGILQKACSLAVVDFLADMDISAVIKLPNDIYVGDRKICGTLIEHGLRGGSLIWSILGIGIDINETDFPEWIPNPVSVRQLTGKNHDIKKCLKDFLRHFSLCYDAIWSDPEGISVRYDALVSEHLSHRRDQQR